MFPKHECDTTLQIITGDINDTARDGLDSLEADDSG